ncbi:hypothetical protein B0H14DRAFT_3606827 [Mycena olivaceomarginata]|nr:hypothetical protein B0H14DRAFT_3606827 [Mycena olivaceomarginata]
MVLSAPPLFQLRGLSDASGTRLGRAMSGDRVELDTVVGTRCWNNKPSKKSKQNVEGLETRRGRVRGGALHRKVVAMLGGGGALGTGLGMPPESPSLHLRAPDLTQKALSPLGFVPGGLMDLPQELVDTILDILHDDGPSLKSCSLAARIFFISARKHIFRKIEIFSSSDVSQRFYELLCSSPHIAPLVEDLCIVSVLKRLSETSAYLDPSGDYMSGRPLSLILLLLTELKQISIIENGDRTETSAKFSRSWSKMDQPLQSALVNVFSSPRLQAVHLRRLVLKSPCYLLSLFSEATALKEMSLSCLYFMQAEHEPWPESQLWRPKLQSLVLNLSSTDFCQYLVNPQIDLTHVRALRLATGLHEQRKKIMQATSLQLSKGVEHLGLFVVHNFDLDLSLSPDLFTTNLRSIHFFSPSIVKLLGIFVKTFPHDSHLKYITLDSFAGVLQRPEVPELYTAIDATVDHLPALKTIEMRWIVGELSATLTQWEADVHAAFSLLMRCGMGKEPGVQLAGNNYDECAPLVYWAQGL